MPEDATTLTIEPDSVGLTPLADSTFTISPMLVAVIDIIYVILPSTIICLNTRFLFPVTLLVPNVK